jgi:hypothetical protein
MYSLFPVLREHLGNPRYTKLRGKRIQVCLIKPQQYLEEGTGHMMLNSPSRLKTDSAAMTPLHDKIGRRRARSTHRTSTQNFLDTQEASLEKAKHSMLWTGHVKNIEKRSFVYA